MDKAPFVSVIIPCRNEQDYIGKCLESVIMNNYPKENLEVLVVDGNSTDATRTIVRKYAAYYPYIRLLDNEKETAPCALNIGIKNAKGEIIARMDAHSSYEKEYISKCIKYLEQYNADNVGGAWISLPRKDSLVGRAIACALSCFFGVGNARYRTGQRGEPRWVDTVPFGCFKKDIFNEIGYFDESLPRNEDTEFNYRLRKSGGRILLAPDIEIYYYARSALKEICRHIFDNGFKVGSSIRPKQMIFSIRHLIPLMFVLGLVFSTVFFGITGSLVIAIPYALCSIYFSSRIAIEKKDIRLIFLMPFVFFLIHFSYGIGSICGFVKSIASETMFKIGTAQS